MLGKLWEGTAEYADALIALLLAVVFGTLGALGLVSQTVTGGAILSTLAVLAVVILRDRVTRGSVDRAIRNATSESREILANLPSRLTRIDELAENTSELKGILEGTATVRTLRGAEVGMAHTEARRKTDRWYFKGGTGTYIRAVTLPQCVEAARGHRRALDFRIEIIDPTSREACDFYEKFRRSVSPEPDGTGDTWYRGRTRLESFATIVAACWNRQRYQPLDIRVGLTTVMSTFRYDMSSEYLIVTQEDSSFPALLIPRDKPLYDAHAVELHNSFEQARRVPLELADRIPLGAEPTAEEVRKLLEALGMVAAPPLDDSEAAIVVQKALHAKNPYA